MVNHIRVKQHKGIKNIQLDNLGHINVLCGRNNSGKTSILEALTTNGKFALGKKVDDANWLCELFKSEAGKYSNPSPRISAEWFHKQVENLVATGALWFGDEGGAKSIVDNFRQSHREYPGLSAHRGDLFSFDGIITNFLQKLTTWYKPVLIPPKRTLDTLVPIELNQELLPDGRGVVNRLFYLKNQDVKSKEHVTYQHIYQTFEEITQHRFNIVPTKQNTLVLLFQGVNQEWLPAPDCGLGLSDIIVIVTVVLESEGSFMCIEEPESHLHAEYQRRMLTFFRSVRSKQFFLTTHSNVFLDPTDIDRLFFANYDNEVRISDKTSKAKVIHSLGYSVADNLVADAVILCEGPTDIPVLRTVLQWLGATATFNIRFWPLGGDIMGQLDLSVIAERNRTFAIVDSDPGSSTQRTRFARNCEEYQIPCYKLSRYSIENYFTAAAIRAVFGEDAVPANIDVLDSDKPVDEQIGFDSSKRTVKTRNESVIANMNLQDLEKTDLLVYLTEIASALTTDQATSP